MDFNIKELKMLSAALGAKIAKLDFAGKDTTDYDLLLDKISMMIAAATRTSDDSEIERYYR